MSSYKLLKNLPFSNKVSDLISTSTKLEPLTDWYPTALTEGAIVNQADYPIVYSEVGLISNGLDTHTASTPTGNAVETLSFGNGIYIAARAAATVGASCVTSTNAINWTGPFTISTLIVNDLADLIYGEGLWLAVEGAVNPAFATSTDTINWVRQATPFANRRSKGAAYGNGVYVVVGTPNSGERPPVYTSTNALDWTARTNSTSINLDFTPSSLKFLNGIFVAPGSTGQVYKSTNGITWTQMIDVNTGTFNVVTYGNGKYIFGKTGIGGGLYYSAGTGNVITLIDSSFDPRSVQFGNDLFVVGEGSGVIRTSTDGLHWTSRTGYGSGTDSYVNLVYNPSTYKFSYIDISKTYVASVSQYTYDITTQFVVPAGYSAIADAYNFRDRTIAPLDGWLHSSLTTGAVVSQEAYPDLYAMVKTVPDNLTSAWTAESSGTATHVRAIVYGNGHYVLAGAGGMIRSSTDGSTWTARTSGTTSALFTSLYDNGIYVAAGTNEAIVSSTNVINWTVQTSGLPATDDVICGTSGGGIFMIGTSQGNIVQSVDGVTWTNTSPLLISGLLTMGYGDGLYLYGGNSGILGYTRNTPANVKSGLPSTFTAVTSGTTSNITAITYGNSLYVYGGAGGVLATSTNAINWTARTSGTASQINNLIYVNGVFLYGIANGSGLFGYSYDGITWTVPSTLATVNGSISAFGYGKGKLVAGTDSGRISTKIPYTYDYTTEFLLPEGYSMVANDPTTNPNLSNIFFKGD